MKRDLPQSNKRLCGGCGSSERWLLHHVRLRGSFQRLCTNCVLKNHPGLFCPVCLDVFDFDNPPAARDRVMCVKCPAIAHGGCANCASFECPPCSQPQSAAFSFFNFTSSAIANCGGAAAQQQLGKDSAKAFVAAARIAANSMKKAAAAARVDAERRVKEAVSAKKKAREALELLALLVTKEKEENESRAAAAAATGELNSGGTKTNPGAMQVLANLATSMASDGANRMEEGGNQVMGGAL